MNNQGRIRSPGVGSGWLWLVALGALTTACAADPRENVQILSPGDGSTFTAGADTIHFEAQLATRSLTNPSGVGLQWVSSLDLIIRTDDLIFDLPAESLTVGQHDITIFAPVRDGRVMDEIRITIQAGGP